MPGECASDHLVEKRGLRLGEGVVVGGVGQADAVEDGQHKGAMGTTHISEAIGTSFCASGHLWTLSHCSELSRQKSVPLVVLSAH